MAKNIQDIIQAQRQYYNLSLELENQILSRLPHPKYLDLVSNKLGDMPDINTWHIESYKNIADPSWPECNDINDLKNLPNHIINECRDLHGCDFLIYDEDHIDAERWANFQNGRYPISELIKYKHTVLDLEEYIHGKKILDVAGHAGMTSLVCLHNGATSAVMTNVRKQYVDLANFCVSLSAHAKNFQGIVADVHNYAKNIELASSVDTVLFYGILYHVHDHFEILQSFADAKPSTIIIDSQSPDNTAIETPFMEWSREDTKNCWNGFYKNLDHVPFGRPNEAWVEMIMDMLGYKLQKKSNFTGNSVGSFDTTDMTKRFVMVFQPHRI